MKSLKNVVTVVKDGKITITADVIEVQPHEYKFPVQQVTIGHLHPMNPRHHRHIQVSGEGLFVKGNGHAFVLNNDDLVAIASQVEPLTSFSPAWKSVPTPELLKVEFSSELEPKLQWKCSDSPAHDSKWTNIEGATSDTLERKPELSGKWVSCVAYNDAGAAATPPIKL